MYPPFAHWCLFQCLALAYHNAQLQASAFREEFDPESFEDLTEPNIEKIHKVDAVSCIIELCSLTRSPFSERGA